MNIAIMTADPGMSGMIPAAFAGASYLLIADNDTARITETVARGDMDDCALAELIVSHGCEAVICGAIEEAPFVIIADEGCVTRYNGIGLRAATALRKMNAYELTLIRDFIGGTGCGSSEKNECDQRHGEDE